MASGGVVGSAVYQLRVDDAPFVRGMRDAERTADTGTRHIGNQFTGLEKESTGSLGRIGKSIGDVGKIAGGFVIAQGLLKLPGVLSGVVTAASDVVESTNKVNVVLGGSSKVLTDFAETSARTFGISKNSALEYGGTLAGLFRAMEIGEAPSAEMSKNLLTLSADMASFNNASPEEVLEALRAGLVGETEPLRRFQVNLSAARVEAEAFAMGLATPLVNAEKITEANLKVEKATTALTEAQKKHGRDSIEAREAANALALAHQGVEKAMEGSNVELSAAQKAQATYSIVMKDTALAQGDFGNTSTGMANSVRRIQAIMSDTAAEIGGKLLPAIEPLIAGFAERLPSAIDTTIGFFGRILGAVSGPLNDAWGLARDSVLTFIQALQGDWANTEGIRPLHAAIGQIGVILREYVIPAVVGFVQETLPQLREFASAAGAVFTEHVIPAIMQLAATFRDDVLPAVRAFFGFLSEHRETILTVVAAVATVVAVFSTVAAVVATVSGAIAAVTAVVAPLVVGLTTVGSTTATLVAILGGPVTLTIAAVVLAVIGLAAAWQTNFLGIRDHTAAAWAAIQPVLEALRDRLNVFVTNILPELQGAWENIRAAITVAAGVIQTVVVTVFEAVSGFLRTHGETIMAILSGAWQLIQETINNVLAVLSSQIQLVLNIIQGDWSGAWENVKTIFSTVWDQIVVIGDTLGNLLKATLELIWKGIVAGAELYWDRVKEVTRERWDAIKEHIDNAAGALKDALLWPFREMRDAVGGIATAAGNNFLAPLRATLSRFGDFVSGVKGAVNWIGGQLKVGEIISGSWGAPGIPGLARGGRVVAPGLAIVGEEGPELVRLGAGAQVTPNAPSESVMRGMDLGDNLMAFHGRGGPLDFARGIVSGIGDLATDALSIVANWAGKGASWVVGQALERFSVNLDLPGVFAQIGPAVASQVKDAMVDLVKGLLDGLAAKIPAVAAEGGGPLPGVGGWSRPTSGVITQEFGPANWAAAYSNHTGIDIANGFGTPIYAANAGNVTNAGVMGGYGNALIIRHTQMLQTLYGHMQRLMAFVGQQVGGGQQIGEMGSTGYSTGSHLHFETIENGSPVNPRRYVPFASGGIVTQPTRALIGEAGPEAVIPLSRLGVGGDDAGAASDEATKIFAMLKAAVELARSIGEAGTIRLPSRQFVADLKFMAEHAIESLGDSVAALDSLRGENFVERAGQGAQAMSAVFGSLRAALDFSRAGDEGVQFSHVNLISDLKFMAEHALSSIGDTIALIDSARSEGFVARAQAGAQAMSAVFSALRAAFDFGKNADERGAMQFSHRDLVADLKFLAEHAVLSIGDTAAMLASIRPADFLEQAQALSGAISGAFSSLGTALQFARSASDALKSGVDLGGAEGLIDGLANLARLAVVAFDRAAGSMSGEVMAAAVRFAEAAGPVLDVVNGAMTAMRGLVTQQEILPRDMALLQANIRTLGGGLRDMADASDSFPDHSERLLRNITPASVAIETLTSTTGRVAGAGATSTTGRPEIRIYLNRREMAQELAPEIIDEILLRTGTVLR